MSVVLKRTNSGDQALAGHPDLQQSYYDSTDGSYNRAGADYASTEAGKTIYHDVAAVHGPDIAQAFMDSLCAPHGTPRKQLAQIVAEHNMAGS
mgnify:CR=1 FL=1